jgi:S1-C subfamily serine protease
MSETEDGADTTEPLTPTSDPTIGSEGVKPTGEHVDDRSRAPGSTRRVMGSKAVAAIALVAVGAAAGVGIGHATWRSTAASRPLASSGLAGGSSTTPSTGSGAEGSGGFSELPGETFPGLGSGIPPSLGEGGSTDSNGSNTSDGPTDAASIARDVDPGVVDITTTVAGGEAAGTGMVLTSNGEVLTNNHVIDGATSISVRDVGNGKTYKATIVGYDRTEDIAVLQLVGASGLSTVTTSSSEPSAGAAVVGIGNAGGTGGTPSYAGGAITGTDRTITASDEYDGTSEQLTGLLATDADIQSGDSGGPLVNTSGEVVGMDTAASSSYRFNSFGDGTGTSRGFAIPIATALRIAGQIESGDASSTVHIGDTAKLGVYIGSSTGTSGAMVEKTQTGSPAAAAGINAGDVITSVDGIRVRSANALSNVMTQLSPGQTVTVTDESRDGSTQSVQVTLGEGVPQ